MKICQRCNKETPFTWYTNIQKDSYWSICDDCYKPLFELEHKLAVKPIIEHEARKTVQKELNRFHRIFGNFYIKI